MAQLYSGRVIRPSQVYDELKKVPHLLTGIDAMRRNGDRMVNGMEVGSAENND